MLKVPVYNQQGNQIGEQELNPQVFGLKPNNALIHQALVAQLANARASIAHAKTRGEVRGGGKKPWKQKGTGRARHGSSRSPIWKGGGVVFGPRSKRNYTQKINKQMKKKAILGCLSDKVAHNHLLLINTLDLADGKTKTLGNILKHLPVENKKLLVGLAGSNKNVMSSAKNLSRVWATDAASLNVKDLLQYDFIMTTPEGLKKIAETYGK